MFEEGYFRPGWITLEQSGAVNFPRCRRIPAPGGLAFVRLTGGRGHRSFRPRRPGYSLLRSSWLPSSRYPGYRAHCREVGLLCAVKGQSVPRICRLDSPLAAEPQAAPPHRCRLAKAGGGRQAHYIFPCWIDDLVIQTYSPFGNLASVLAIIIESFARRAPKDTQLVIKEHPLDPHLTDWRALDGGSGAALWRGGPRRLSGRRLAGAVDPQKPRQWWSRSTAPPGFRR